MPDFGISELLGSLGLDALLGAGAGAATDVGASAATDAALGAGFGGITDLASLGLPFGAGAGELGSVATGLGPAGVSAFGDTAAIASALGLGAGAGIPLAAETAAAGLPAFAGAGEIGAVSDIPSVADALLGLGASSGTGIDLTGALTAGTGAGTGAVAAPDVGAAAPGVSVTPDVGAAAPDTSGLVTSNASLATPGTTPTPVSPDVVSTPPQPTAPPSPQAFSGTTSVGPTAGTPAGPLSGTGFDTAQTVIGGQAPAGPGAVSPIGPAGSVSSDLTSQATGAAGSTAPAGKSFLDQMVSGAGKSISNNWLPALIGAGALGYNILQGNKKSAPEQALNTLPAANANLAATALGQIPATTQIRDAAVGQVPKADAILQAAGAQVPKTDQILAAATGAIPAVTDIQSTAKKAADTSLGQGSGLVEKGTGFTNYLPTATLPPDQQAALDNATAAAKTRIISNHADRGLPTDPKKNSVLAQELSQVDRDALSTKAQMEGQLLTSGTQLIGAGNQTTGAGTGLLGTGISAAGQTGNLLNTGTSAIGAGTNALGTGLNAVGTGTQALGQGLNATQVADQLTNTGLKASGLTSDLYTKLVGIDQTQQAAISQAIQNFAKALGGTNQGGLSLKLA